MSLDTVFLNSFLCWILLQGSVSVPFSLVYKEKLRDSFVIFRRVIVHPRDTSGMKY